MGRYLEQLSKEEIAKFMNGMECPFNFRCCKKDFSDIKFNRPFEGWNAFKCQYENPRTCPYSSHYGYCHICKCPLFNYIDISRELEADLEI